MNISITYFYMVLQPLYNYETKRRNYIRCKVTIMTWITIMGWKGFFFNKKVEILTLRLNFEIKKSILTLKSHNYEIRSINDNKIIIVMI